MIETIKIAQHNICKCRIASLQLRDYCHSNKIDIILLQEPLIQKDRVYAFESSKQIHKGNRAGAAIVVLNEELRIIELAQHTSDHVVAIRVSKHDEAHAITVVSAYFKYNMPTLWFVEKLHAVLEDERRVLIGADVNAHSKLWHSTDRNERGLVVEGLIEDHDLGIANRPSQLRTYDREGMGSSNIDVTLFTPSISNQIGEWSVLDNTDSDHNTLVYNLEIGSQQPPSDRNHTFVVRKADWNKFTHKLLENKPEIDETSVHTFAKSLTLVIQNAARASMPSGSRQKRCGKQPWWNNQLDSLKKELDRQRRNGSNVTNKPEYNALRNRYLKEIRSAKMAAWRHFSNDINTNAWGKAFKWAKNGSKRPSIPSTMKDINGVTTNS
ncbi:uncharacterized protein LOC132953755 [Metopolophium dirhodum]|uniref:uncharacterized protein LOC132953755 n=1 Tax=Metopolophium dirhodum TaxID=44670 RepID=UPI00298F6538|nr:uncharacterized protein LOC132953755 [Metopolophium dirhodum]